MRIAEVCRTNGALVLADEIYALTTYDIETFVSMGTLYPEGTFVTGGLSKDRSAAGYRFGACILPSESSDKIYSDFAKTAATLYTNITTPVQYAAITAYSPPDPAIDRYLKETRDIHRMMGGYFSRVFSSVEGISTTKPHGAFYFLADLNELKLLLEKKGIVSSNNLQKALLAHPWHVATVTGGCHHDAGKQFFSPYRIRRL